MSSAPEQAAHPLLRPRVFLAALMFVVLAMNSNILDNELLNWDDAELLSANPRVQPATLGAILRVFDPSDALAGRHLEFIPARDLAYATLFYLWGLSPLHFHLAQILAHGLACVALFFLARRLIGERPAIVATSLFAVHPVHVEAIAWISALKDPTFTGSVLAAIAAYLRWLDTRRFGYYAASLAATLLALGFKQIAVVAPALIWLTDLCFVRRPLRATVLDKLPFALLVAAVLPLFLAVGRANAVIVPPPGGTPLTGFMTMTVVYASYLGKLAFPAELSARYLVPPVMSPSDPRFLVAAALVLALWVGAAALWRRSRLPAFVLGWYTIALLPVLNIIPIPIEMADRYLYLPSVGFAIGVGAGFEALSARVSAPLRAALPSLALLVFALLVAKSVTQNEVWQDDVSLWRSVLEVSPEFYVGRNNLAHAYLRRDERELAEAELREAIRLKPDHATSFLNLGTLLRKERRNDEARAAFERAVELKPDYAIAYNNLASLHLDAQRWEDARAALDRALSIDPEYPTAHLNYAIVCRQLGDLDCALQHLRAASDARPAEARYFADYLTTLAAANRADLALEARQRLELRFASDGRMWQVYARVLGALGRPEAAEAAARAAALGAL